MYLIKILGKVKEINLKCEIFCFFWGKILPRDKERGTL